MASFDSLPDTVLPLIVQHLQEDLRDVCNLAATSRSLRAAVGSSTKRTIACLACGRHVGNASAITKMNKIRCCQKKDALITSDIIFGEENVHMGEPKVENDDPSRRPRTTLLIVEHRPVDNKFCYRNLHCACGSHLGIFVEHMDKPPTESEIAAKRGLKKGPNKWYSVQDHRKEYKLMVRVLFVHVP